jgi:hypothetical protein
MGGWGIKKNLQIFFYYYVGAHAKFWNPMTIPSGVLTTVVRRKEKRKQEKKNMQKILAYLSLLRWSHALHSDQFPLPLVGC